MVIMNTEGKVKVSRTYEAEMDVNDIQIGDKISIRFGNFGEFTATARRITDQGVLFVFDKCPRFMMTKSQKAVTGESDGGQDNDISKGETK